MINTSKSDKASVCELMRMLIHHCWRKQALSSQAQQPFPKALQVHSQRQPREKLTMYTGRCSQECPWHQNCKSRNLGTNHQYQHYSQRWCPHTMGDDAAGIVSQLHRGKWFCKTQCGRNKVSHGGMLTFRKKTILFKINEFMNRCLGDTWAVR